jgi:hypothetical protein
MAARELFRMVFFFKNGKELTKIVRKLKTRNKKTPSWIFVQIIQSSFACYSEKKSYEISPPS